MGKKVIIVGSGFGGLSTGIRLINKGFDVEIFEKNERVGGHAYQLKKDGYTFDMGPSLITAPKTIKELFEISDRKLDDYLELTRLDPFYRIYFHDKRYIDYTGDSDGMKKELAKFSQKDSDNYDSFMKLSEKMYYPVIAGELGTVPFDNKVLLKFLPQALKLGAFWPLDRSVGRYFKSPEAHFAFSFHPLFIGGNPYNAPSVYLSIPYLEKTEGVWYSKGGMYSLVEALQKLFLELGGKIHTNSEVQEILINDSKVKGVKVNGSNIESDIVVSNAHFANTYKDLIKESSRKKWTDKKVKKMDYSMSCFVIYLGTKKQYPQLLHHTLILSERYKGLVNDIFEKKILPDDFSIYLHAPTRTDDTMAPEGCESMYMLIPTPNLAADVDWDEIGESYTNKIIDFLENDFGLDGLRENIEVLETFSPKDFEKVRNNYLGACWSLEPKLTQTAMFRPGNRSEDIDNLYLVGASTHPGGGVPGVMLGAKATTKAVIDDHGTSL